MKDTWDFPAFTAHQLPSNVLHIALKKVKKLTSADVSQMYDCYKKYNGSRGAFVLVTFSGYFPLSDDAMIEANKPQNQKIVKAMAYVIKSSALRIGAKFFMNFYKPKYSSSVFGTKPEAITWLLKEQENQS
jgi:hypothetical protein